MTETRTTIFADGILDAHVNFGVARLTLAQTGQDGKPVPAGQLCVPLVQLPGLAKSLLTLVQQVEARMKEQQAAAKPEAPAAAPVPGSFRFG
jgi:hypothetical protein